MNLFGPPPTVLKRLTDGLKRRTDLDTQFQLDLFNRILQLLRELQQCPGAIGALPPGTAGQLTITEAELAGFIYKLENPENMGPEVIEDIVDPLYSIGNEGNNTLRRTERGGLPGSASVLPRSTRRPREVPRAPGTPSSRFGFSSLFGSPASPEAPGSYKPATGAPPSYLSRFGYGSPKAPVSARSAGTDPFEDVTNSSNPIVNKYRGQQPNATVGNNIDDPLTDELFGNNSRLGGSRRKTRRARKYRNRT
jgi:hypothetical protein